MLSRQRTMPVTCSTSWLRIVSGSVCRLRGDIGVKRHRRRARRRHSPAHRASPRRRAASAGNGTAPRPAAAPRAWRPCPWPSRSRGRSRPCCPEITTWLGSLSLATVQTSPSRGGIGDLLRQREVGAEQRRHRALRRPAPPAASPGRAASAAWRWSRDRTSPPRTSAEYSPRLWPATKLAAFLRSTPPSLVSVRNTASEWAMIAGCAFSVSLSSSSGPSRISRNRFWPSASSTSSNTSRARPAGAGQRRAHADRLAALPGKNKCAHRMPCSL